MKKTSFFYKALKKTACKLLNYQIQGSLCDEPAIYLCRHNNVKGPVIALACIKHDIRPWVLSIFFKFGSAFRQFYGYTYTERFKLARPLAFIAAVISAAALSWLSNASNAVKVYRGSGSSLHTVRRTVNGLIGNESFLIFPDIDYSLNESSVNKIYEGFLICEKLYMKKTGRHLPFVPICIIEDAKIIRIGEPVFFRGNAPFGKERKKVAEKIMMCVNQINREAV